MPLRRCSTSAALLCVLLATTAGADLYRVEGEISDPTTSRRVPLAGLIELAPGSAPHLVTRFALEAGAERFIRPSPFLLDFESGDQVPATDDQLAYSGGKVASFQLSTEALHVSHQSTAYQRAFLDGSAGSVGELADASGLPTRFEVEGALLRSSYTTPSCFGLPLLPSPTFPIGGNSGGEVTLRSGDAHLEIVDPSPHGRGDIVLEGEGVVVTAPGDASERSEPVTAAPSLNVTVDHIASLEHPSHADPPFAVTLEDLRVQAPDGATVRVSPDGGVTVETTGDLFVNPGLIEIEGQTSLEFRAGGDLVVGPAGIQVPDDVHLTLHAGREIDVDPAACPVAVPVPDAEIVLGDFSFRAERITPVDVSVRRGERLSLRRRGRVSVVVEGSEALDVRDLDRDSLRFGPMGATLRTGRRAARYKDLDGDGHMDLLLRFRKKHTGIQLDDTSVCLQGRTGHGVPVLGCATIAVKHGTRLSARRARGE